VLYRMVMMMMNFSTCWKLNYK